MIDFPSHTSGEMIGKGRSLVTQLGDPKQVRNSHRTMKAKAGARLAIAQIEQEMKDRRKRTNKQGPSKVGATLKAQAVARRIEAALRRKV